MTLRWRVQPYAEDQFRGWLVLHHWKVREDWYWFIELKAARACRTWLNKWKPNNDTRRPRQS